MQITIETSETLETGAAVVEMSDRSRMIFTIENSATEDGGKAVIRNRVSGKLRSLCVDPTAGSEARFNELDECDRQMMIDEIGVAFANRVEEIKSQFFRKSLGQPFKDE